MIIELKRAAELLKKADNVLILIHSSPDGDTIGSGYALQRAFQKKGKTARVECVDTIPPRYKYITGNADIEEFEPSFIVAVDVADIKLLGKNADVYASKIDLCIDHHMSNTLFAKESFIDSSSASNCENIYKILKLLDAEIDMQIAQCLYTGIATDTGCFKFSNTTAQSHEITSELMKYGLDPSEINRIMFDTKTKNRLLIEKMAVENMEFYFDDRCAIITITKEMRDTADKDGDDLEGITVLSRQVEGVLVGITMREKEKSYKISVRTHEPINASDMCAVLGGGGHARAAGCEIEGKLQEVKKRLLTVVAEKLGVK